MFDPSELTWADIKSTPIPGKQYLEKIKDPVEKQQHMFNYSEYQPKLDSISQIQKLLEKIHQTVKILGIGASWCGDCARNVAHMIKIQEKFKKNVVTINILGGIKKKLGGGWAVPPSPPEALDPKFDLIHIPIFYLFDGNDNCFGRIVENPTLAPTLEEELFLLIQTLGN
jgi:thiol-disulfide isomerase/thioredoxin